MLEGIFGRARQSLREMGLLDAIPHKVLDGWDQVRIYMTEGVQYFAEELAMRERLIPLKKAPPYSRAAPAVSRELCSTAKARNVYQLADQKGYIYILPD